MMEFGDTVASKLPFFPGGAGFHDRGNRGLLMNSYHREKKDNYRGKWVTGSLAEILKICLRTPSTARIPFDNWIGIPSVYIR